MVPYIQTIVIISLAGNVQANNFPRYDYIEYIKCLRSEFNDVNIMLIEKQREILHKAESILLHEDIKNNFNISEYVTRDVYDHQLSEQLFDFHKQYTKYKIIQANTTHFSNNNIEKVHRLIINLLVVDDKPEIDKLFKLVFLLSFPLMLFIIIGTILDISSNSTRTFKFAFTKNHSQF